MILIEIFYIFYCLQTSFTRVMNAYIVCFKPSKNVHNFIFKRLKIFSLQGKLILSNI